MPTLADTCFDAKHAVNAAEEELWNAAESIAGKDQFDDITFDYYDRSFELRDAKIGLILTSDQRAKFATLGFSQCWIVYTDKSEKFYDLIGRPVVSAR